MSVDLMGKSLDKIKDKKLFLFDMDGTIYLENTLFDGVKELLSKVVSCGGRFVFITNNSSKSVVDYVDKVKRMGLDVTEENFFTSTQAATMLLTEKAALKLIYAQGTKSFIAELKNSGLNITEKYDENAEFVLVGFDPELTGEKLRNTCKMLKKDVPYYATNPDWVCPVDFGYIPDCGSMCFGIEKATGKAPIYIGKPQPTMIEVSMKKWGVKKEDTIVIGDRIYTDIASGVNAGVETALVLSGETTKKDYDDSQIKSTYLIQSVKDLLW
jgi:HAD superfamily hydrolase (TIGR01450 family)